MAALLGITGAAWLALHAPWPAIGWLCFLASNVAWIVFARIHGHRALGVQQIAFLATSIIGVFNAV
jgi:hypothetical protein